MAEHLQKDSSVNITTFTLVFPNSFSGMADNYKKSFDNPQSNARCRDRNNSTQNLNYKNLVVRIENEAREKDIINEQYLFINSFLGTSYFSDRQNTVLMHGCAPLQF